jgi:hypothetical protein
MGNSCGVVNVPLDMVEWAIQCSHRAFEGLQRLRGRRSKTEYRRLYRSKHLSTMRITQMRGQFRSRFVPALDSSHRLFIPPAMAIELKAFTW